MKKTFSILIATVLCVISVTVNTSAATETVKSTFNITANGVEYTIEFDDTTLSSEQQQVIAEKLINGNTENVQTYGLTCTLFGHKNEQNTVAVITHEYKDLSPRCKREQYLVTTCSICDYQEQILIVSTYIVCCPED